MVTTNRLRARSLRPLLGLAAGALLVGASGCKKSSEPTISKWGLPVDAKQLPSTTQIIEAEVIDGTREADPHVRQMFTAAELGAEICHPGSGDPARTLELMGLFGSSGAKQFFKASNLADVQALLECGALLASNLDGQFQTAVGFTDDSSVKQDVGILTLKLSDLPPKYGLTKHAFGGIDGFCRTLDPSKPNATPVDCGPASEAALHQGSTWFLGKRSALDGIAHTISTPKSDMSTGVAALNDAAAQIEGLSSTRIQAQLTTVKPFLQAPCAWGGFQTTGNTSDFVQACFPTTDDKVIQDIDAKLRAAAFEIEPDVLKAGAVHGNIVLVARDDDAAKEVQKDATDLVADWKSTLENNEAKIIKQAKANPTSLRQKSWAIIVDNFIHALQKATVSRSGRAVKMAFNEPLVDEDRRDLADANKQTLDKRLAAADLLDAIAQKKPIPQDSLAKIVGAPWAAYLAAVASYDPSQKAPPTTAECTDMKKAASKIKAKDMTSKEGAALLVQIQAADCKHPPQLAPSTHTCLTAGFHTGADLSKCAPPAEPSEADFGDKPAARAAAK